MLCYGSKIIIMLKIFKSSSWKGYRISSVLFLTDTKCCFKRCNCFTACLPFTSGCCLKWFILMREIIRVFIIRVIILMREMCTDWHSRSLSEILEIRSLFLLSVGNQVWHCSCPPYAEPWMHSEIWVRY